ncbi:MAG: rod shape-determining protein MreC [Sphingorhabdus sp.]
MAPPPNRRPGFSRKAQYGLFATYVVAVTGTIFAALLLVISVTDPTGFATLRTAGAEITAPVARFFNSIRRTTNDVGSHISAYYDAASKNAALTREVQKNRTKLVEAKALRVENARLRGLLKLNSETPEQVAVGRLISSTASSSRRVATLSIGANYNVTRAQPVRGPSGLIGRVVEVGPTTARILLITDAENLVPVMRASDGLPAFATGLANGMVVIKPLNLGESPFKVGDIIVTSGNGGLYPPNVPFAKVLEKTSEGALARPLADPANTPYAMVMKSYQAAARTEQQAVAPDGKTEPVAE